MGKFSIQFDDTSTGNAACDNNWVQSTAKMAAGVFAVCLAEKAGTVAGEKVGDKIGGLLDLMKEKNRDKNDF